MQRAVSVRAKCRPVPGAPQSRMTFRAVGAPSPARKAGAWPARRRPRSVLPQHHLFHLSGQPFEAAQMLLSDFGGSFGQQAVGLHVLEHLPALGQCSCVVSLRSSAFCFFSISSSFFCCSSRAAFISGRPGFSGGVFCVSKRSFPPGPNTPFIKFSQSSVYAICLPPSCVFSSIVYFAPFCKKSLENPRAGGYTNFILI